MGIISHNKEFCENVATEKWIMKGGYLRIEGESVEAVEGDKGGNKVIEDVYDGAGNKVDVKKNVALSAKDAKKKKTLTEEEMWELEDKLTELKEQLSKE